MRHPRRILAVFALFLALAGAGCALLQDLGLVGAGVAFDHVRHAEEDLACLDCHKKAATEDLASLPKMGQCMKCHEGIDEEKPPERRLAALYGTDPAWSHVTVLPGEVIFSHKVHGDAKVDCAECHRGIQSSTRVTSDLRVAMADCMACHARQPLKETVAAGDAAGPFLDRAPVASLPGGGAVFNASAAPEKPTDGDAPAAPPAAKRVPRAALVANDCAVCHREIRRDTPPASHETLWRRLHGQAARDAGPSMADRCTLCHTEASCSTCHQQEAPASHTAFWRERGHGIAVGIDRSACFTCHRSDACDRCHHDTAPRSHVGAWGGSRSNHCYSCHDTARGEGCGLCHRGAPSHLAAEPKPSWHNAGMNCRSCHFPVPHADGGMDCNACHR